MTAWVVDWRDRGWTLAGRADIISEVIPEGAVEVTGSGLPIIMLADHQTTGGYVKPFVVASAALGMAGAASTGRQCPLSHVLPR